MSAHISFREENYSVPCFFSFCYFKTVSTFLIYSITEGTCDLYEDVLE